MAFYLRKSLRAGPFRFNLSQSGLGVSVGVPGFRVGTGPRGNYVHVGTAGVHYRASLSGKAQHGGSEPPAPRTAGWKPPPAPAIVMEDTTGATATQLLPSNADEFVAQLNQAARRRAWWPWALALFVGCMLGWPTVAAIVLFVVGTPALVWLYLRDQARRSVVAFYQVDGPQSAWFQSAVDGITGLAGAAGLWRIDAAGNVKTTYQYKVNSGASTIISRVSATASLAPPRVLVTNIAVPSLVAGQHSLHFLPDRVLVRDRRRFASLSYDEFDVAFASARFIETQRPPRDGQQIDTTWQYVNVRGGPDRRFKDNRQYPVMLYGRLTLGSATGLSWIVDCSQADAAQRVARILDHAVSPSTVTSPAAASQA